MRPRISAALRSLDDSEWITPKEQHPMPATNGHGPRFHAEPRRNRYNNKVLRELVSANPTTPRQELRRLYRETTGQSIPIRTVYDAIAKMRRESGPPIPSLQGRTRRINHDIIREIAHANPGMARRAQAELYEQQTGVKVSVSQITNVLGTRARPEPKSAPEDPARDPRFDPEVDAIRRIHEIMSPLDPETATHVARWVAGRFLPRGG